MQRHCNGNANTWKRFSMAKIVHNEFLEKALVSPYDEFGHEIYRCSFPWTTKFYFNSKTQEKKYIDVDEEIFEEDIPNFCNDLRNAGVSEFTFSYEYSANQSIAKVFEDNGFKLTKVHYYPVKEISWYHLEDSKPTEDLVQVPEELETLLPAYFFEDTQTS